MDGIRTLLAALVLDLLDRWTALTVYLDDILAALTGSAPPVGGTGVDIVNAIETASTIQQADNVTLSGQIQQIIDLLGDYVVPYLENIFYATLETNTLLEDGTRPIVTPPPSTGFLGGAELAAHCQRVQWMIDFFFDDWMVKLGDMIQGAGDAALAIGLAALVVATEGIGAVPLSLLSSGFIAARAARDAGVDGMQSEMTTPRRAVLRNALYSAPNAAAALSAWASAIDTMTDVNIVYRTIWKVLMWSTWMNDLYDPTNHNNTTEAPLWNLTGYEDDVCAFVGVIDITIDSDYMTTSDGGTQFNMIEWPGFLGTIGEWASPDLVPNRNNSWQSCPIGTVITVIDCDVLGVTLTHPTFSTPLYLDDSYEVTSTIAQLIVFNVASSGYAPFTIRVEVPEP